MSVTNIGDEDDERATFRVEEVLDRVGQLVVSVPRPAVGGAVARPRRQRWSRRG